VHCHTNVVVFGFVLYMALSVKELFGEKRRLQPWIRAT